eukprot:767882-Hanusia_phi.AAC.3
MESVRRWEVMILLSRGGKREGEDGDSGYCESVDDDVGGGCNDDDGDYVIISVATGRSGSAWLKSSDEVCCCQLLPCLFTDATITEICSEGAVKERSRPFSTGTPPLAPIAPIAAGRPTSNTSNFFAVCARVLPVHLNDSDVE